MTVTVSPYVVWGVLSLALFGVVFVWRVARDAARDARAWLRDGIPVWRAFIRWATMTAWCRIRRQVLPPWVSPLLENDWLEPGTDEDYQLSFNEDTGQYEELLPERSNEELGFTGPRDYLTGIPVDVAALRRPATFLERLEARRERLASAAELEHRAAYEAMGLEYPSGLMARVREAAP